MNDPIQQTITGLSERTTDHFNAIAHLTQLIEDAYPGEMTPDGRKQLEAYVGRIVADVESRALDTFTAADDLTEARKLAAAGVPDFLDLITIGDE